jgi:hypothetical protein
LASQDSERDTGVDTEVDMAAMDTVVMVDTVMEDTVAIMGVSVLVDSEGKSIFYNPWIHMQSDIFSYTYMYI